MYDFTKWLSMVVHGMPTIASTRAEWVRSKRETAWDNADIHSLSCGAGEGVSPDTLLILNWLTRSSKASDLPYIQMSVIDLAAEVVASLPKPFVPEHYSRMINADLGEISRYVSL